MTIASVIRRDIASNLCDAGNFFVQLWGTVVNGFFLFFTTYVFGDMSFLMAIGVLIAWDVVTGAWLSVKRNKFQFTILFKNTIEKIVLYSIFMSAFWIATGIEMSNGTQPLAWLDMIGYSWLAANEVSSIVKNIAGIKPGFFPAWIIDKFKQFDRTGKFEENG